MTSYRFNVHMVALLLNRLICFQFEFTLSLCCLRFTRHKLRKAFSKFYIRYYDLISKEVLAIMRIFSLVDMITNAKFSKFPNVFKIGIVQQ